MVASENNKVPAICIAGTHSGCGKTTVTLGIMSALSKRGLAQSSGIQALKASYDQWELFYPGKYNAQDSKIINAIQTKLEQVNNYGDIDIDDLVSGKLHSETAPVVSWNPMENNFKVTLENMRPSPIPMWATIRCLQITSMRKGQNTVQ